MASKKIQATATLFLDTSSAQQDAAKFVKDIKQKLNDLESASDKMSIFKDMVGYIAQVDRALAMLRAKNGNAFNHMFDGLDTNLKGQLQDLFGISGEDLGKIDVLREKLETLTPKSSIKEIRNFAKEINAIFTSAGMKAPFSNIEDEFSGRVKPEYLEKLSTELSNFAIVWQDVNSKVSKGFGVKGSGGSGGFGGLSQEVQDEINKLEKQADKYQSIISKFEQVSKMKTSWDDGDKIELDIEATEQAAQELIEKFHKLNDAFNEGKFAEGSDAYADALAERAKIALQLIEINERLTKKNKNGDIIEESPKFLRDFIAMNDDGESLSQYALEDFEYEAEEILDKLQGKIAENTQKITELKTAATDAFSSIGTGASSGSVGDTFENIGNSAEESRKQVNLLTESLQKALISASELAVEVSQGKAVGKEHMNLFDASGLVSTTAGLDYQVDTSALVSQLVANLKQNIVMSLHDHPDNMDVFSASDIKSFTDLFYGQGTKIHGIIADGYVKTIDFNGMPQEIAQKIARSYAENLQKMSTEYANLFTIEDGTINLSEKMKKAQIEQPKQFAELMAMINSTIDGALIDAFQQNGVESTLKVFDLSSLQDLAGYLVQVQQGGQNALTPVEKLKNLITSLNPDRDIDFSKYSEIFEQLEQGAIDGTQALNKIFDADSFVSQIDKAKAALQEFLALQDKIMALDSNYNIDDVGIGQYTERLEAAKKVLDEFGAQGLLTADELSQVEEAYNMSRYRLELETRNYTGHGSGYGDYSYSYYDDYKQEKSEKEDLQNELIRKEEKIAELESDLRASDDALQETLGNKYALIEESQTLEIERANLLLQKQKLEYEDVLALMQSYQNLQTKAKEAFDYGDEKTMHTMQDLAGQIYDRVVPQNLDDFTEPDRWFKAVGMSVEEGAQKLFEFRERLDAIRSSQDDLILSDFDDVDDLQKENGSLEDKLDLLREISEEYANNITQRDRNRYEELSDKEMESGLTSKEEERYDELGEKISEADDQLNRFGETYEKITLKLADGKKIDILPDDAGLRKFDKIANEFYQGEYNGVEIVDVDFVRQEQFLQTQISSYEELCEVVERYNQLALKGSSRTLRENLELDAINQRFHATKGDRTPEQAIDDSITWSRMLGPMGDVDLDRIANYLGIEIPKAAGNAEVAISEMANATKLFEASDGQFALFDNVSASAQRAEDNVTELESAVKRIENLDGQMSFFDQDELLDSDNIDQTEKVLADSEIAQLDALQAKLLEVKAAVDAKTMAFSEEATAVGAAVQSEMAALQALSAQLGELLGQISAISDGLTQINSTKLTGIDDTSKELDAGVVGKDSQDVVKNYALDSTLAETNGILQSILGKIGDNKYFADLTEPLMITASELKKVMSGIVEQQQRIRANTSTADARISDPKNYAQIRDIALNAIKGRVVGGDADVTSMTALADGVVAVKGYLKTAENAWEGFSLKVNAANEVSKIAYDTNASAAKEAAKAAKEAEKIAKKTETYDKDTVEARAQAHLDEYTGQGKQATVQFKENGKYTITVLEEVDGLSKQISQTFDENDEKIERTTAKVSNKQKIQLENLQKVIDAGAASNLIGDDDLQYKQYRAAADELERMNNLYRENDNLSDEDILKWNSQIKLVQQLGNSVEGLINKRKVSEASEVFKSDRSKKLSKFDLDVAKLRADIEIPDSFDEQINAARKKIEDAVDADSLKVAVNGWESLQNQIKQTATEQDLYIKKAKEIKDTSVDDFSKSKTAQVSVFSKYKDDLKDVDYLTDELRTELDTLDASLQQVGNQSGLDAWIKQFNALRDSINNARVGFTAKNDSIIDVVQKELTGSFNRLSASQKETLLPEYAETLALLKQQKQAVKDGQAVELAGIKQITAALQEKINQQLKANQATKEAESLQKKSAKFGDTTTMNATLKYNALSDMANRAEFDNSSVVTAALDKYTQAYDELINKKKQLSAMDSITPQAEAEFKNLAKECNDYAAALDKIIKSSLKLKSQAVNDTPYILGDDFTDDKNGKIAALTDFVQSIEGADIATLQFKNNWEEAVFAVNNGDGTFTQMSATFTAARNEIVALAGDTKKVQGTFGSFMDELKGKFKSIGTYLMASVSFYEVWAVIRQGITYVTEIDTALTELKKVTDETDASYSNFLQSMSKTGSEIGATVADLTTMASEWARLGYSMEDAGKLAESTAILLNVSEFDDATEASEALISTMQAFQYTADESQYVVDVLNEVGNNYAVSSDGIATALQDSASALMEGGNNLEQAVALVAAANKVVYFVPRCHGNMAA